MRWTWLFLVAVAAFSVVPGASADHGFDNSSIQGTWAFSATGTFSSPSGDKPFALVGLTTFESSDRCSMTFTINAGGISWSAVSTRCTFGVEANGTGVLNASLAAGQVPFPPLALAFVIANDDEIHAIRTDDVVASGVFRRQAKSGRN